MIKVILFVFLTLNTIGCGDLLRNPSSAQSNPPPYLTVLSMFKNEKHALPEWVAHHEKQGAEHFVLIDNGSTDDYLPGLQSYIDRGLVQLIKDAKKAAQLELLNKYFLSHVQNQSTWVMLIDLDEFVYARNGFESIPKFLRSLDEQVVQVTIPWKMFGSNGHIQQPPSIIHGFTRRGPALGPILGKSIVRTDKIKRVHIHSCMVDGLTVDPLGRDQKELGLDHMGWGHPDEPTLPKFPLHLNHYQIQSLEWWENVKLRRGDVYREENPRALDTFYNRDANDNQIIDDELSLLSK